MNLSTHQHMMGDEHQFDDFPLTNMLETHYTSPSPRASKKARRKGATAAATSGSGHLLGDLNVMDTHDEDGGSDEFDDDEVTEEDIQSIVKMTDYIEKYVYSTPRLHISLLIYSFPKVIPRVCLQRWITAPVLGWIFDKESNERH